MLWIKQKSKGISEWIYKHKYVIYKYIALQLVPMFDRMFTEGLSRELTLGWT